MATLMMSVWASVSATAWVMTSGGVVAWLNWGLCRWWFQSLWTLMRAYVFSWSRRATRSVGEGLGEVCAQLTREGSSSMCGMVVFAGVLLLVLSVGH